MRRLSGGFPVARAIFTSHSLTQQMADSTHGHEFCGDFRPHYNELLGPSAVVLAENHRPILAQMEVDDVRSSRRDSVVNSW